MNVRFSPAWLRFGVVLGEFVRAGARSTTIRPSAKVIMAPANVRRKRASPASAAASAAITCSSLANSIAPSLPTCMTARATMRSATSAGNVQNLAASRLTVCPQFDCGIAMAASTTANALSLYKQLSSPEIGAVVALRSLGTAFALEGRDDKALSVLNDALHRAKTSFNGNAELTGEILNSLGMVYQQRRNYKKAENFFLEVVRMKSSAGGRDFLTANALNNLAQIHREQRKYTTAEKEYRQCLEISDALLGPSHPQAAITRSSLGLLYLRMGRLDDAEAQLSESLRIVTQTNPLIPGRIVRILHMLGETYSRQGKVNESEAALARAVAIARNELNHDPETAAVLEEYSTVLKRSGKTEQARATHSEADRARAVTDLTVPVHGLR